MVCSEVEALERINYPLFLLAQAGAPLSEPLTSDEVRQTTSLAHRVISSVVLQLIREPAQAHGLTLTDQAGSIEQLALEGKRIIESSSGMKPFELAGRELHLLEQVLARIPPEDASQYFHCESHSGLVLIRCRRLPQLTPAVTRHPLYAQLRAQNPEVKLRGKHYISCPAAWFLDLLAKFYGGSVVLNPPSKSVEPRQLQDQIQGAVK